MTLAQTAPGPQPRAAGTATAPDPHPWRLVPRLLLRRAGFGFDLLGGLADQDVSQAALEYRQAVAVLDRERAELLGERIPAAVSAARQAGDRDHLRALSRARSAVGRYAALPHTSGGGPALELCDGYGRAQLAVGEALQRVQATLRREEAARPTRLRRALGPAVLDALVQLSPSSYLAVSRWTARTPAPLRATAKDRALMRRCYLFVQRLAAKNETTSSFGPLEHGLVDERSTGLRHATAGTQPAARGVTDTRGFVAFWAVGELARAMAQDRQVRDQVPVTWIPAARLEGCILTLATGRKLKLSATQIMLATAVDDRRTPADLAALTCLPISRVHTELAGLERAGAVRCWPEPSSTAAQPFDELIEDARRLAGQTPWPQRLGHFGRLVEEYAEAGDHNARLAALTAVEDEFTALTGEPARRAGGQMYADRSVAYLESCGDLAPVRLGRDLAEEIADQLAPVLQLGARHGDLVRQAHQRVAAAVLLEAGVASMRYDAFIRRIRLATESGALDAELGAARALVEDLTALAAARTVAGRCDLVPQDLRRFADPGQEPRFASPDLLPRQTADGLGWVLGELHPYLFAWGSQHLFAPDPEALRTAANADLSPWGGATQLATILRRRQHKGLVSEVFPGRFVEVTARATRDRERALGIGELTVRRHPDRVALHGPDGELVLYAGEDDHPHLAAFAPAPTLRFPLIRLGSTAPRISVGPLVVQRAGWWLGAGELRGDPPAHGDEGSAAAREFAAVQRLRARLGIPRWVYAHVPGQPKPVCVDLDAPLAVEALLGLLGPEPDPHAPVALREMLPAPDELWLHRDGRPVTSELRLAMIRSRS